jgi:hypothetical protein
MAMVFPPLTIKNQLAPIQRHSELVEESPREALGSNAAEARIAPPLDSSLPTSKSVAPGCECPGLTPAHLQGGPTNATLAELCETRLSLHLRFARGLFASL